MVHIFLIKMSIQMSLFSYFSISFQDKNDRLYTIFKFKFVSWVPAFLVGLALFAKIQRLS